MGAAKPEEGVPAMAPEPPAACCSGGSDVQPHSAAKTEIKTGRSTQRFVGWRKQHLQREVSLGATQTTRFNGNFATENRKKHNQTDLKESSDLQIHRRSWR